MLVEILNYLRDRVAEGDERFTASGVSRDLELPPDQVRAVLVDLASGSGSTHILDMWIEYECPEDASTLLLVQSGQEPPVGAVVCPTSGHDILVADCNLFVTYRPTEEFREGVPRKKAPGGLAALRRRLTKRTA